MDAGQSMNIGDIRQSLALGDTCQKKLFEIGGFKTVLDIGGGDGRHSKIFAEHGCKVTFIDFAMPTTMDERVTYLTGNYLTSTLPKYDLVWCCHVLEHIGDIDMFLEMLLDNTFPNGLVAITVPPLKHQIVGGHLSLWNAGLLIYRLVLAGQDCSVVKIIESGYNISLITRRKLAEFDRTKLRHDFGDIEYLKRFFPIDIEWGVDSFNGDIKEYNWN